MPTWLLYLTVFKLILKGILSYILFEALYKVLTFLARLTVSEQYLIHLAGMRVAEHFTRIITALVTASLFAIYVTWVLNAWGTMLNNIWHWVKYQQTIVVFNWQPCSGPGQFCMPWHEGFPMGRQPDPIQSCVDYIKGLDMRTQYSCILQLYMNDPPQSYVKI